MEDEQGVMQRRPSIFYSEREIRLEFGVAYDQPKCLRGHADDVIPNPYRYLKHWYLYKKTADMTDDRNEMPICVPFPPNLLFPTSNTPEEGIYTLAGWLQPCDSRRHSAIFVEITGMEYIAIDGTREYRGYWIMMPQNDQDPTSAMYWLQDPSAERPFGHYPSQEDLFLEHRAGLAALSNVMDFVFKAENYDPSLLKKPVAAVHKILTDRFNGQEPFDRQLLARCKNFCATHLRGVGVITDEKCKFYTSLKALKMSNARNVPRLDTAEELTRATMAAEERSQQYPWGGSRLRLGENTEEVGLLDNESTDLPEHDLQQIEAAAEDLEQERRRQTEYEQEREQNGSSSHDEESENDANPHKKDRAEAGLDERENHSAQMPNSEREEGDVNDSPVTPSRMRVKHGLHSDDEEEDFNDTEEDESEDEYTSRRRKGGTKKRISMKKKRTAGKVPRKKQSTTKERKRKGHRVKDGPPTITKSSKRALSGNATDAEGLVLPISKKRRNQATNTGDETLSDREIKSSQENPQSPQFMASPTDAPKPILASYSPRKMKAALHVLHEYLDPKPELAHWVQVETWEQVQGLGFTFEENKAMSIVNFVESELVEDEENLEIRLLTLDALRNCCRSKNDQKKKLAKNFLSLKLSSGARIVLDNWRLQVINTIKAANTTLRDDSTIVYLLTAMLDLISSCSFIKKQEHLANLLDRGLDLQVVVDEIVDIGETVHSEVFEAACARAQNKLLKIKASESKKRSSATTETESRTCKTGETGDDTTMSLHNRLTDTTGSAEIEESCAPSATETCEDTNHGLSQSNTQQRETAELEGSTASIATHTNPGSSKPKTRLRDSTRPAESKESGASKQSEIHEDKNRDPPRSAERLDAASGAAESGEDMNPGPSPSEPRRNATNRTAGTKDSATLDGDVKNPFSNRCSVSLTPPSEPVEALGSAKPGSVETRRIGQTDTISRPSKDSESKQETDKDTSGLKRSSEQVSGNPAQSTTKARCVEGPQIRESLKVPKRNVRSVPRKSFKISSFQMSLKNGCTQPSLVSPKTSKLTSSATLRFEDAVNQTPSPCNTKKLAEVKSPDLSTSARALLSLNPLGSPTLTFPENDATRSQDKTATILGLNAPLDIKQSPKVSFGKVTLHGAPPVTSALSMIEKSQISSGDRPALHPDKSLGQAPSSEEVSVEHFPKKYLSDARAECEVMNDRATSAKLPKIFETNGHCAPSYRSSDKIDQSEALCRQRERSPGSSDEYANMNSKSRNSRQGTSNIRTMEYSSSDTQYVGDVYTLDSIESCRSENDPRQAVARPRGVHRLGEHQGFYDDSRDSLYTSYEQGRSNNSFSGHKDDRKESGGTRRGSDAASSRSGSMHSERSFPQHATERRGRESDRPVRRIVANDYARNSLAPRREPSLHQETGAGHTPQHTTDNLSFGRDHGIGHAIPTHAKDVGGRHEPGHKDQKEGRRGSAQVDHYAERHDQRESHDRGGKGQPEFPPRHPSVCRNIPLGPSGSSLPAMGRGRGRAMTTPAWMTRQTSAIVSSTALLNGTGNAENSNMSTSGKPMPCYSDLAQIPRPKIRSLARKS